MEGPPDAEAGDLSWRLASHSGRECRAPVWQNVLGWIQLLMRRPLRRHQGAAHKCLWNETSECPLTCLGHGLSSPPCAQSDSSPCFPRGTREGSRGPSVSGHSGLCYCRDQERCLVTSPPLGFQVAVSLGGKTLVWGWSPRERQGAEPSGGWSPTPGRDGDRKEAGHRRGLQTCWMDDLERICLQRALQDLPRKCSGVQQSP